MRKLRKRGALLGAAALIAALLLALSAPAMALDAIDPAQSGSLTIETEYADAPLSEVTLSLYRVADVDEHGRFALTEEWAESGAAVNDLERASQWSASAAALADWAQAHDLPPVKTGTTAADGTTRFTALTAGLYLVTGETLERDGMAYSCAPYLVSLPALEGDSWNYSVRSVPKLSGTAVPTQPEQPEPEQPAPSEHPTPGDATLPQTGQLRWPIPVLAVGGMVMLALGLWLNRQKKHE